MALLVRSLGMLFVQVPATGCSVVGRVLREQLVVEEIGRKHEGIPELAAKGLWGPPLAQDTLVVATVRNPFDRWVTYYQRLVGAWTDDYLAWARRDSDRKLAAGKLTEQQWEKTRRDLEIKQQRLSRRARVIRLMGFNLWLITTVLRLWMSERGRGGLSRFAFPMLEQVDLVLRQERLQEGLNELLGELGSGHVRMELPAKNLTPGKQPYAQYYRAPTRAVVSWFLADELARFGYAFEGPIDGQTLLRISDRARSSRRAPH